MDIQFSISMIQYLDFMTALENESEYLMRVVKV
jgi:hypothetical protein